MAGQQLDSSSALMNFLSDPATLIGLGVIAAGTAYYLSTRPSPANPPVPLDNQSLELPVRFALALAIAFLFSDARSILYPYHSDDTTVYSLYL